MTVLTRLLIAIILCMPNQAVSTEGLVLWQPVAHKIGWWVYESPYIRIIAAMRNDGLQFIASYACPPGSVMEYADVRWYAGDRYSTSALNCNGLTHIEDISFHRRDSFVADLPVLLQIHYQATALARNGPPEK